MSSNKHEGAPVLPPSCSMTKPRLNSNHPRLPRPSPSRLPMGALRRWNFYSHTMQALLHIVAQDKAGWTALSVAVRAGLIDNVETLVIAGADVNKASADDWPPLVIELPGAKPKSPPFSWNMARRWILPKESSTPPPYRSTPWHTAHTTHTTHTTHYTLHTTHYTPHTTHYTHYIAMEVDMTAYTLPLRTTPIQGDTARRHYITLHSTLHSIRVDHPT